MPELAELLAHKLFDAGLLQGVDMPSFHLLHKALEDAGTPDTPRFSEACDIVNAEMRKAVADIIRPELRKRGITD